MSRRTSVVNTALNAVLNATLVILGFVSLAAPVANAADVPQSFTLDGRLWADAAGTTPLQDSSIAITIQILDDAKVCVIYEEQQTISTAASKGYFSIQVGTAVGNALRSSGDSANSMSHVFQNMTTINGKLLSNGAACTVPPVAEKRRYVRIKVLPASMGGVARTLLPDLTIDSVPNAIIAERAESLQGLRGSDVLQVNTASGSQLSQTNLESLFTSLSRFNALTAVVDGTSTNYMRTNSTSGAQLPVMAGAPTSPAPGSVWYDSSDSKMKYQTSGGPITIGSGAGTVTSVGFTAPSELSVAGAPVTTSGTIAVTWATQTANKVFASPDAATGTPSFRALVPADVPGLPWTKITSLLPTTLGGYGITDAVRNVGGTPSFESGLNAAKGAATTAGRIWISTDTKEIYRDNGATWDLIGNAATGTGDFLANGTIPMTGTLKMGGNTIYGNSTASGNLTLESTSDATKGHVILQPTSGNVGIGATSPSTTLDLNGAQTFRGVAAATAPPTAGQGKIYFDSTANKFKVSENNGAYVDLVGSGGGGTVTSVGLSLPAEITVTNSPVTTSGTLTGAWANQTANKVFASPDSATGAPTFRALVANDIPALPYLGSTAAAGGDLSGNYPNPTVNKIRSVTVSATAPNDGQVLKYVSGTTSWTPSNLSIGNLLTAAGAQQFAGSASCTAAQTLTWSSLTDTFTCANIAGLDAGVITTGTIAAARLPASASVWTESSGDIYRSSGNVGIGTSGPSTILDINGGMTYRGLATGSAPATAASQGKIYFDSTLNKFRVSENNGAYVDLVVGNGSASIDSLSDAIATGATTYNLFLGSGVGASTTGTENTAAGQLALQNSVSGSSNTAFGTYALNSNVGAGSNTAIGHKAMQYANSSAAVTTAGNTAVGQAALRGSGTPASNTGSNNTAIGREAQLNATNGSYNTSAGHSALRGNQSGSWNVAMGYNSLTSHTSGSSNVAMGAYSMHSTTSGGGNTALGDMALEYFVSGSGNVAVGSAAGGRDYAHSFSGNRNIFLGQESAGSITSGDNNIFIGYRAGNLLDVGSNNIVIGTSRDVPTTTTSNFLNIGDAIYGNLSNGNVGIGTTSPLTPLHVEKNQNTYTQFAVTNSTTGSNAESGVIVGQSPYSSPYAGAGLRYFNSSWSVQSGIYQPNQATLVAFPGATNGLGIWTDASAPIVFGTNVSASTANERMRIDASGNVGIGTTNPGEKLEVSGNVKATAFISTSDRRLKTDIREIEGLDIVNQLTGVRYNWKSSGKADFGLIAQDVEAVLPEAVITDSQTGLKAVKYSNLVSPMIQSIKELYRRLIAGEEKTEAAQRDIATLKENQKALLDNLNQQQAMIKELIEANAQLRKELATSKTKGGGQ